MQQKLELIVSQEDVEAIDLYHVAQILQGQFPDRSITELTWQVAQVAVEKGARYLIWEPPVGWDRGASQCHTQCR